MGSPACLIQILIQVGKGSDGVFLVAEGGDDLVAGVHLLYMAVQDPQRSLLIPEIGLRAFGNPYSDQQA